MKNAVVAGLAVLFVVACLCGLAWLVMQHPIHELVVPREEVINADGSHTAATLPPAQAATELPPPAAATIPKGATVMRRDRAVLQPRATAASACPPVTVDLQTYRDGNVVRVVASSPDATVLRAVDVPLEAAALPPPPHRWALGLSYRSDRAPGAFIERDFGRVRLGAEVSRTPTGHADASLRVGITF